MTMSYMKSHTNVLLPLLIYLLGKSHIDIRVDMAAYNVIVCLFFACSSSKNHCQEIQLLLVLLGVVVLGDS